MIAPGSTYVALGSSYAAGPGIPPVVSKGALRSGRNYPHQVADALSLQLIDVTCSGATTANILSSPQRTVGGLMCPQIEAVALDARLVTITAAGNDLGYIGALTRATIASNLARAVRWISPQIAGKICESAVPSTRPEQFRQVTAALVELVERVRSGAPKARILLVDYLTVLGPEASKCDRLPLTVGQVNQLKNMGAGLARAFEDAANISGGEIIKASEASINHGLCSAEPWVSGFEFGNPFKGGVVPFHPTLTGMTAVADLVVRRLSLPTSQ